MQRDIAPERSKMTCSVCSIPLGACFKCSYRNCLASFHPLCARTAGLTMITKPAPHGRQHHRIYCSKHGDSQGGETHTRTPAAAAEDLEHLKRLRVRGGQLAGIGLKDTVWDMAERAWGFGGRSNWNASACCVSGW